MPCSVSPVQLTLGRRRWYETLVTDVNPVPTDLGRSPPFLSRACQGCHLTCPRAAVLGHQALLGDGREAVWGSRTEGRSRQAGGAGTELRGVGEAVLSPPPRHPPSAGKQRGFSLLGLMTATHLKSPVTSLVPGGLEGKHHLLVPPPARRREGEDWGLPEAGALHWPGRAWPLPPPGPVAPS